MDAPLQTPLTFISQRPSGRQYIPDGAPLTMHHMSQRHPPETTVEERTTLPWLHSSQKMEECQDPRNLQLCPVSYCHILIHFWGNELWCSPGITGVPSSTSMATAKLWWLSTSGCKLCCSSKTWSQGPRPGQPGAKNLGGFTNAWCSMDWLKEKSTRKHV